MGQGAQPLVQSQSELPRFCRVCAIVAVVFALGVIALLVLLFTRPEPPPDYGSLPLINSQDWDALNSGGWTWLKRTATNDATIAQQTPTPVSPTNVAAIDFTGVTQDAEPGVLYHPLPGVTEVYAEWWIKFSANWTCAPAGCGKVSFFFPPSGGDLYMGVYCDSEPLGSCGEDYLKPPYFIVGGQLQFGEYAGYPILANVTRTHIVRDRWYHFAHYLKWSTTPTARDGIWRIYVDNVLNLERTDIAVSIAPAIEFQFAPTRQPPPPPGEFMWIDHTILRGRTQAPGR